MAGAVVAGHFLRGLAQAGEIGGITKIAREKLNGRPGLLGQFRCFLGARPLGENLAALVDANAVAQIVTQDDIETGQENSQ